MERETNKNVPPAEEIVISRVPPPVMMTQPFDMQSDSTSVASSVKENKAAEGDNYDTMVNESSVGSSVDINELETFAGETGGGAVAIHVADADKGGVAEQKLEDLSSGCDGMNQASELGQEIEHSSPSREEIQTLEAVSPNSAARTRSPDAVDGTNQNSRPETPPQHVLDPGIKTMEPSTSRYVLLGLPIDALHAIASFLSPKDFCNLGLCSKGATKVSGDVFRRVRMHGFLCATEVVTAWKLNQHSDAKELCALYIGAGVPIYPVSLGHSYHTLVWRMGIEAQEMQNALASADSRSGDGEDNAVGSNTAESNATRGTPRDRFFVERYETRVREGLDLSMSYLEEKSLYMLNTEKSSDEGASFTQSVRRQMAPSRFLTRPQLNNAHPHPQNGHGHAHIHGTRAEAVQAEARAPQLIRRTSTEIPFSVRNDAPHQGLTRSNSHSDIRGRSPKVVVKVHRHLLDQHLLGRPLVDDKDGLMTTAPVNLSADFFHPHFKVSTLSSRNESEIQNTAATYTPSDGLVTGELLPAWNHPIVPHLHQHPMDLGTIGNGMGDILADPVAGMSGQQPPLVNTTDDSESDGEAANHPVLNAAETIFEPTPAVLDTGITQRQQTIPTALADGTSANHYPSPAHPNILANVDLEVYSASSANKKVDGEQADREIRHHLRTRCAVYQRRLENLLSHHDSHGFDECILDFWDEYFPHTANIQYYDRNTAVPRISCLHKFLTRPCPKALGVVQCEIERIKLGPKKKGVNMKGRFFPTYEYRLFIRHRPPEAIDGSEPPRRDTVLMMAKNRGRKHVESSSSSAIGKKGANNYFLYIPQQEDVEHHFRSVNASDTKRSSESITNGASSQPMLDGPALMGRLQSNFIGTEFQIFTPQVAKKGQMIKNSPTRSLTTPANSALNALGASEDEFGYDSGVSSDNPSSSGRRRSRFGRLSLRRNTGGNTSEPSTIAEDGSTMKPFRRSRSSGDMVDGNRRARTSRRAIANNSEGVDIQRSPPSMLEEEDGAITYTANLLGSRPRIMDVCIPRVSHDGVPGAEWKNYIDKCLPDVEGGAGNRMLNHLKQIQQRLENEELGVTRLNPEEIDANTTEDYSPPDDFGLLALQNRPPWWNIELGSFVLNFGGRVSVASVKNFQLCDRVDQDYIMLQFGRIQGRHSFTMDFQHPLTAVQAFAIAISSLQSKISFG